MVGRRSALSALLVIAIVSGAALALGVAPPNVEAVADLADEVADDAARSFGQSGDGSRQEPPTDTGPPVEHGIDKPELERKIHERINDVRSDHNLSRLEYDTELRNVSRYHSRDMARNDYFAHTAPDGETMQDRYELFGYDCRIDTGSGYATGGENLFVLRFERVSLSESQIAAQAVGGWMRSPGHRRNVLRPYWEHEAIGVDVIERDGTIEVYVTQHFC